MKEHLAGSKHRQRISGKTLPLAFPVKPLEAVPVKPLEDDFRSVVRTILTCENVAHSLRLAIIWQVSGWAKIIPAARVREVLNKMPKVRDSLHDQGRHSRRPKINAPFTIDKVIGFQVSGVPPCMLEIADISSDDELNCHTDTSMHCGHLFSWEPCLLGCGSPDV